MASLANTLPTIHLIEDARARYDVSGGFTMIPDTVRQLNDGYALAVYEAIARHANQDGDAWPTITRICELTGWSKPHVIKTINKLCDAGIITKTRRQAHGMNSSTLYQINANVRRSTTFTARSTTDTQAVNQVYSGGQPGLPKQEPIELKPNEQSPSGDTPLPPKGERAKTVYTPEFESWFQDYPKGRGSKAEAFKLWKRMSVDDRQAAIDALPLFIDGRDWQRGYHPAPEVWLRGRRWENPPLPSFLEPTPLPTKSNGHDWKAAAQRLEAERSAKRQPPEPDNVIDAFYR